MNQDRAKQMAARIKARMENHEEYNTHLLRVRNWTIAAHRCYRNEWKTELPFSISDIESEIQYWETSGFPFEEEDRNYRFGIFYILKQLLEIKYWQQHAAEIYAAAKTRFGVSARWQFREIFKDLCVNEDPFFPEFKQWVYSLHKGKPKCLPIYLAIV